MEQAQCRAIEADEEEGTTHLRLRLKVCFDMPIPAGTYESLMHRAESIGERFGVERQELHAVRTGAARAFC